MSHNAVRTAAAGIAIAAAAAVSFGTDNRAPAYKGDPSVPAAWEVFHANDGRAEGNDKDMTY